tara:strand:+ start:10426 stop:10989 length:564 start_codon:yes stop_codon:yes gene_type:complete
MKKNIARIIVDKNVFTEKEKRHVKQVILENDFPWFWNDSSLIGDGVTYFSHQIILRPEQRKEDPENVFNNKAFYHSGLGEAVCKLATRFIKKHKLPFKEFLRASLNLTIPLREHPQCTAHTDHDFPHHQIIFYLNTTDGDTVLLKNDKEYRRFSPEAFKAVSFGGQYKHYVIHPTQGRRVILVITFH